MNHIHQIKGLFIFYAAFKKIYLYQNRVRLSRAELTVDGQTMSVIHSTSAASDAWENCKRSRLGLKFDKLFKISKKTKFER